MPADVLLRAILQAYGLGKVQPPPRLIDWLGSGLVADWRRFCRADLASDVEEAIPAPRHWATIGQWSTTAPGRHQAGAGRWSEYRRIADELLQNVSASRIGFSLPAARRAGRPRG